MARWPAGAIQWTGFVVAMAGLTFLSLTGTSAALDPFVWPAAGLVGIGAAVLAVSGRCAVPPIRLASLFALAGWVAWRAATSPVEYAARHDLVLASLLVAGYLIGATCMSAPAEALRGWLCGVLVSVAVAGAAVGIYQFAVDPEFNPIPGLEGRTHGRRATGFFPNANHLAAAMELGLPLVIGLVFALAGKPKLRLLLIYVGLVLVAGALLTGSRGGAVSLCAGLLVAGGIVATTVAGGISRRSLTVAAVAGLLGISGSVVAVSVFGRILQERGKSMMEDGRTDLWLPIVAQFRESPWTGTGSRTYEVSARQLRPSDWGGWRDEMDPVFAHNDYLQFLAEYGIVGCAFALLFGVVHAFAGWRFLKERSRGSLPGRSPLRWALAAGGLGSLAALAVHEFFDFNLHVFALMTLAAVMTGCLGACDSDPVRAESPAGSRWAAALLGLAAVALLAVPGWRAGRGEWLVFSGRRAMASGRTLLALDELRRGVEIDPAHYPAWVEMGQAYQAFGSDLPAVVRDGFFEKAANCFDQAVRLYPDHPFHHMLAAQNHDYLREFEQAEDRYRTALQLAPNHVSYRRIYHDHLLTYGYFTGSTEILQQAADYYRSLGQRRKLREAERLIEFFREAEAGGNDDGGEGRAQDE